MVDDTKIIEIQKLLTEREIHITDLNKLKQTIEKIEDQIDKLVYNAYPRDNNECLCDCKTACSYCFWYLEQIRRIRAKLGIPFN